MQYEKPEMLLVGLATDVVLGELPGSIDGAAPDTGDPEEGIALGLDM